MVIQSCNCSAFNVLIVPHFWRWLPSLVWKCIWPHCSSHNPPIFQTLYLNANVVCSCPIIWLTCFSYLAVLSVKSAKVQIIIMFSKVLVNFSLHIFYSLVFEVAPKLMTIVWSIYFYLKIDKILSQQHEEVCALVHVSLAIFSPAAFLVVLGQP